MGKRRSVTEELKYLVKWELIGAIVIVGLYFVYKYIIEMDSEQGFRLYAISFYPLLLVSSILIQGSLYWNYCLKRIEKKNAISRQKIGNIYSKLRWVNWGLILLYLPLFFVKYPNAEGPTVVGGIILYVIALIEQVNYFHIRLSYNGGVLGLKIVEPIKCLLSGRGKKSQIAKDIDLYLSK